MGGEGDEAPGSGAQRALGELLAGRYRLQSVLGEGGMAIVYEGEHVAIGKRVAIKLVQSLFANDDEVVRRFEHEARSASAVESEHIVHVFDAGADPERGLFLVMELLIGEDLEHLLARRPKLEPLVACGIVDQAALGLEKAHAAGVVHRDLKPANVFLVERDDGTTLVKLVDFGIAKLVREAHDARFAGKRITRRGTAIGTPQYMSPEQAQALDSVDHRTDVYSLGAVLFEAIAGQPHMPERPTYEQTILQVVSTTAPRLSSLAPEVPPALDDLVAEMLERDVSLRVKDMRTVRERIEAVFPQLRGSRMRLELTRPAAAGEGVHRAPTLPGTSAAIVAPRRRRSIFLVAGLAALLGTGLGLTAMWRDRSTAPAAARAAAPPPPLTANATVLPPEPLALPPAQSAEPSARARPTPPASASAPPASSTSSARRAAPVAAPSARGHERDQVGAAGISSAF